MSNLFSNAIESGIVTGMVKGLWDHLGILTPEAIAYLDKGLYKGSTPVDRGLLNGLLKTGHLKRKWIFLVMRTDQPLTKNTLRERVKYG